MRRTAFFRRQTALRMSPGCGRWLYAVDMSIVKFADNRPLLFWLLQLWGWSAWAITTYLGVVIWSDPPASYPLYLLLIAFIGMLFTLGMRQVYQRTWNGSLLLRAALVLICSYGAAVAWVFVRSVIFPELYPEDAAKLEAEAIAKGNSQFMILLELSLKAAGVMVVWSAVYFGIKYYMLAQEDKQRYLAAVGRAKEAQLKMLRYQLNPHFLFNTLNAISTLILDLDNRTANEMVTKLSRFLRYSLENDPMQEATVADEVASLKLYLDIEKVRFAERLRLEFFVADDAEAALMPSMLLQPLVENSIKYAISQSVAGGCLKITACVKEGELQLRVIDDGPGVCPEDLDHSQGTGVGLANIRGRLQELYGAEQSFDLSATQPHGLTVAISLPCRYREGNRA